MGFTIRDGDVTVTLSDDLEVLARRAVDAITRGGTAAVESKVAGVLAAAQSQWPVVTGRSKGGLDDRTTVTLGSGVRVSIDTSVGYTFYIRPRSLHGATTAWQRWIRGPMYAARKALESEIGPVIGDALKRDMAGK